MKLIDLMAHKDFQLGVTKITHESWNRDEFIIVLLERGGKFIVEDEEGQIDIFEVQEDYGHSFFTPTTIETITLYRRLVKPEENGKWMFTDFVEDKKILLEGTASCYQVEEDIEELEVKVRTNKVIV